MALLLLVFLLRYLMPFRTLTHQQTLTDHAANAGTNLPRVVEQETGSQPSRQKSRVMQTRNSTRSSPVGRKMAEGTHALSASLSRPTASRFLKRCQSLLQSFLTRHQCRHYRYTKSANFLHYLHLGSNFSTRFFRGGPYIYLSLYLQFSDLVVCS